MEHLEWQLEGYRRGRWRVLAVDYRNALKYLKLWDEYHMVDLANYRLRHVESGNIIPMELL